MIGLADLNAPLRGVLAQACLRPRGFVWRSHTCGGRQARSELLRVRRIVAESEDGRTAPGDPSPKAAELS